MLENRLLCGKVSGRDQLGQRKCFKIIETKFETTLYAMFCLTNASAGSSPIPALTDELVWFCLQQKDENKSNEMVLGQKINR